MTHRAAPPNNNKGAVPLLALWLASGALLVLGLTRPVIEVAVNVEGVLRDALDRQPVLGLLLQERGLRLDDIAAKLPPSSVARQSVVTSVTKLYRLDCYSAATLILNFSIVIPALKQAALLLVILTPRGPSRRLSAVTQSIHKWAMLDVFVLSTVVLALSSATAWNAALLEGFYWFLGYFFSAGALGALLARRLKSACGPSTAARPVGLVRS